MRIAVLGSWRAEARGRGWETLRHADYFEAACNALGGNLAAAGHDLIVAQAVRHTADKYVRDGFTRAVKTGRCTTVKARDHIRTWGAAHIEAVRRADAVIVIGGGDGTYSAGKVAVMTRKLLIPVGCFGGAAEELVRDLREDAVEERPTYILLEMDPSADRNWRNRLTTTVARMLAAFPRLLIIHGRSHDRNEVKKILKRARRQFPNLPEPIVMSERGRGAPPLPDLFESLAARVDAAIAVVTPDDIGAPALNANGDPIPAIDVGRLMPRARENVWVEVGWFWGRLGTDRIMILKRGGRIGIPSDLRSLLYKTYEISPEELATDVCEFVADLRGNQAQPRKKGKTSRNAASSRGATTPA